MAGGPMIGELIGEVLSAWGGEWGAGWGLRRAARRARRKGRLLAALRVPAGSVEGLTAHWSLREVTVLPGEMSDDEHAWRVRDAVPQTGEPTTGQLIANPLPEQSIIMLNVEGIRMEMTVLPEDVARVVRGLKGSS
ncbi:hypothetical protein LJR045_002369 [Microbacterium sp. LjRoot45]|uniref:hypothetical protein n=1 Tax=Microbacterium sp. LjRoot45 TaxID=3342329 RepID=UPI003ED0800C